MTYKIYIGNWGAECVAGVIPDKIWKYIQDECDGDFDTYKDKLGEDEVPDEFKIAEDEGSYCDCDSFFNRYGPYSDGTLTVCDEDGHEEFMTIEAKDLPSETEYVSASMSDGKPYFVWASVEKGGWFVEVETDEPFDKSKLKLYKEKFSYDNDDTAYEFITRVEYDGEEYDVEVDSTRGKSYEVDFYKDNGQAEVFAPMDDLLERIAKSLEDAFAKDGDDANTDVAEKNILGYISDLNLDDLEKVDSVLREKDGLYIDATDSSYYALVKNGKTLLAFER